MAGTGAVPDDGRLLRDVPRRGGAPCAGRGHCRHGPPSWPVRSPHLVAHLPPRQADAAWYGLRAWVERGFRHVRVQVSVPGTDTYGAGVPSESRDARWDSLAYLRVVPKDVMPGLPEMTCPLLP